MNWRIYILSISNFTKIISSQIISIYTEPEGELEAEIYSFDQQQAVNCSSQSIQSGFCIINYNCSSFKDCVISGEFKCTGNYPAEILAFTHWEICPKNSKENCTLIRENIISLMKIFNLKNEVYQIWSVKCIAVDMNKFPFPNIKAFAFSLVFDGILKCVSFCFTL